MCLEIGNSLCEHLILYVGESGPNASVRDCERDARNQVTGPQSVSGEGRSRVPVLTPASCLSTQWWRHAVQRAERGGVLSASPRPLDRDLVPTRLMRRLQGKDTQRDAEPVSPWNQMRSVTVSLGDIPFSTLSRVNSWNFFCRNIGSRD